MRINSRMHTPRPEPTPIGGGYFLMGRSYQIEAVPDRQNDPPFELTLIIVIENGRPVIDELHVKRAEGASPITGQTLRRLPLMFLLRAVPPPWPMQQEAPGKFVAVRDYDALGRVWHRGSGGRKSNRADAATRLGEVVRIYKQAILEAIPPTKEVADRMKISRSYAGKLVASARSRGLLGAAPAPGKAGEVLE